MDLGWMREWFIAPGFLSAVTGHPLRCCAIGARSRRAATAPTHDHAFVDARWIGVRSLVLAVAHSPCVSVAASRRWIGMLSKVGGEVWTSAMETCRSPAGHLASYQLACR